MPRPWLAAIAGTLCACTSVTSVVIPPAELRTLSDIGPNEERSFVPLGRADRLTAQGDDEIQIRLETPEDEERPKQAWARLYTLHVGHAVTVTPTSEPGRPDCAPVHVPLEDVSSAEIQMERPDGGKTTALLIGVVLASMVLTAGVIALVVTNTQKAPIED